jgi:hydroxypyruvate isomerase
MSGKVELPKIINNEVYEKNILYAIDKCQKEDITVVIEPINKYSVSDYYMNDFQKGINLLLMFYLILYIILI